MTAFTPSDHWNKDEGIPSLGMNAKGWLYGLDLYLAEVQRPRSFNQTTR
jgi:hypothetical protein